MGRGEDAWVEPGELPAQKRSPKLWEVCGGGAGDEEQGISPASRALSFAQTHRGPGSWVGPEPRPFTGSEASVPEALGPAW